MSQPLLELIGISKRFAGAVALSGVSLSLAPGEILALVGENGAGKSTLMKILSGVYQPDEGEIRIDGQAIELRDPQDARERGISIIYQEFSLVPDLNAIDNLFLGREPVNWVGATRWEKMRHEACRVLGRLGVDIDLDSNVSQLGIAQQQFLEIAKALMGKTRVLVMDEPTATLTDEESQRLLSVMRELATQGTAIIFISHHLDEVFQIAKRIVCLRDGQCVGTRNNGDVTRGELIQMMVGRDLASAAMPSRPVCNGPVVLDVRRVQRRPDLPANAFQIRQGEILGVAGLVGSGRTKMVRALLGIDRAHRRDVLLSGKRLRVHAAADSLRAGIGLVPEDRKTQGLVGQASVRDNILFAGVEKLCHPIWRYVQRQKVELATREQIEQLRIKTASPRLPVRYLSGGNQQKVVLAKWLLAECSVLILDEPTRGIDIGAKEEIYVLLRRLCDRGLAMLFISSEVAELISISDRLMVMRGQRIVHTFPSLDSVTEEAVMHYAAGGASD